MEAGRVGEYGTSFHLIFCLVIPVRSTSGNEKQRSVEVLIPHFLAFQYYDCFKNINGRNGTAVGELEVYLCEVQSKIKTFPSFRAVARSVDDIGSLQELLSRIIH